MCMIKIWLKMYDLDFPQDLLYVYDQDFIEDEWLKIIEKDDDLLYAHDQDLLKMYDQDFSYDLLKMND
jgi:hypothetical protein